MEILTLLLSGDHVLQEVNGHLLVARQIIANIHCKQVVHLPLGSVLGGELLGADLNHLIPGRDLVGLGTFHNKK